MASTPVEQKIIDLIHSRGPITFADFMEMALYDPDHGYYAGGSRRIGREGDFYTSSHVHPAFGGVIAGQLAEMWDHLGRPDRFTIVEMGAGEGYLCGDILERIHCPSPEPPDELLPAFARAVHYVIAERSPELRHRQQVILDRYGSMVSWVAAPGEAGRITGCVVSNELVDAFPVHLVRMEEDLKELCVFHDGSKFSLDVCPGLSPGIREYFADEAITLARGYTTEVNLRARDWLSDISRMLDRGFVVTIDYGYPAEEYYSDDRERGTLICYYRHQYHEDPFLHIGEQDLTSHVNFSSLKRWGEAYGLSTAGYCSQGTFLLAAGIDRLIARLDITSPDHAFELARIKRLFLPQGLGESHKVLIQCKGMAVPKLRGFSLRNQMRFL